MVPLVYFYFCCLCFGCLIHEIIAKNNVKDLFFPIFYSRRSIVSGITFKSLVILLL